MAVDFKDLKLEEMLKLLPEMVVEDMEGRYIYNLEFAEVDGTRITNDKYYVIIDNGKVECGEGHSEDPEATLFTVNQGGVDTLIAFQVHGLKAATSAMIMGYIFASNIKKAEAWFKILKIGEEPIFEAMRKVGLEPGDTSLEIYNEFML